MSAILLALALAASPSTKLGVHVVGDDAVLLVAPVCPGLAVFPLTTTRNPIAQVTAFRSACPGSQVVAQVGNAGMGVSAVIASSSWLSSWFSLLQSLGSSNFDAVEGPSEPQGLPANVAAFWSQFADLVQSTFSGKLVVVGSFATGTATSDFCPTAAAMVARGGSWAWSYHAFSTGLTQVVATESSTTLGYRALRDGCTNLTLTSIPIYLTQAGRAAGAWQPTDLAWLAWLDARLAENGEVVGAALFEAGGTDRSLAPIVTQLAAYLQNPSTPDGGTPDAGADAGAGGIALGGGNFVPGGTPAKYPSSGCASAGAGAGLALLVLAPLLLRRRKRDHAKTPHPSPLP